MPQTLSKLPRIGRAHALEHLNAGRVMHVRRSVKHAFAWCGMRRRRWRCRCRAERKAIGGKSGDVDGS
eukprot:526224-Amphidinium_carterae.2